MTITIKEYLNNKGIIFKEYGNELITRCVFNNCDKDSAEGEAHLYFNAETGQYDCKKCGAKGNLITLAKHLGDNIKDIFPNTQKQPVKTLKRPQFNEELVESCHNSLPDHIRQYLNDRGITGEIINKYKLGWGEFYGKFWITIPIKDADGSFSFFKLRQDPDCGKEKMTFPKSAAAHKVEAQIYDWETLQKNTEKIFICEGELDRLLLMSKGIPAITGTNGAGTFKQSWADKIKNCKQIYVCFDRDEAGRNGATRVLRMLTNFDNETYLITLPVEVGDGGDVTDYFTKLNGNVEDLFTKYARRWSDIEKAERIKRFEKVDKEISFEEWQRIIKNNFPELVFPAEYGLAIMAQILIRDITNPFSLVFVDVPSAGKTIAINFFSEIEGLTYATDKFTPASFVSNATNIKQDELAEIDLLPKLKYKMFLIRDLSTIFSKRDDDLNECLGILTRVLDGEGFNADTGVHGKRHYVGEYLFMILAGSTPIHPRVWKMMGSLGSRLFFLNMGARDKSEDELADQITTLSHKEKEEICRSATKNFLHTLWHKYPDGVNWDRQQDNREYIKIITRCAKLLAKLRGTIVVWKELDGEGNEYSHNPPVIEKPDRITQLFYNLCRGHALVSGRTQIDRADLKLILELAIDSCPPTRAKFFRRLLENNGVMKTSEVVTALKCTSPTAAKEMMALEILDICHINYEKDGGVGAAEKTINLNKEFGWFLSDECKDIRNKI